MDRVLSLALAAGCCGLAWGQSKLAVNSPASCDSTKILSVENFATGQPANSLGGMAKISWCDFEFPPPTTPVTSILVHGQKAFITLQGAAQTSPVTSVIFHGHPSFSPQQIVAQLPNSGVPVDTPVLQLRRGNQILASRQIQVGDFAPGIFTLNGVTTGPAIVWDSTKNYILQDHPAHIGEAVTVFCEGLGPTDPFVPSGSVPKGLAVTTSNPQVFVGGQLASVIVSKLSTGSVVPSLAGVYEVTFVVPSVPTAPHVVSSQTISMTIGGKTSNTATLPAIP